MPRGGRSLESNSHGQFVSDGPTGLSPRYFGSLVGLFLIRVNPRDPRIVLPLLKKRFVPRMHTDLRGFEKPNGLAPNGPFPVSGLRFAVF